MANNSNVGTSGQHLSKTFRDYVQEARTADHRDRNHERDHAREEAARAAAKPAPAPAPSPAPATAPEPVKAVVQADAPQLADILRQLDALGEDKEAKKQLIGGLPMQLHAEVLATLKQQKEERKSRDAELEDLL